MFKRVRNTYIMILTVGLLLTIASCSNTKYLPKGEVLYTGAEVSVKDKTVSKKKRKNVRKQLASLTRPKPNATILGLRVKLWAYNIAGTPKKENGFPSGWLKNKVGEPPVLLSDVSLDHNVKVLESHLVNKGYFNAKVEADTTVKKRRAKAYYTVTTGSQYVIDSIAFPPPDSSSELVSAIRETTSFSLLKKGDPFDLDVIRSERVRIDDYLKEHGFYYFNPDYLLIKADSTIGSHRLNLFVTVKPETPRAARNVYHINDVFIFTSFNLSQTESADTSKKNATFYKGYYVVDRRNFYKPRLFQQSMQFYPGDVYSRTEHNATINRLINLDIFKFVKNRFDEVPDNDSALLNTYYYLTRQPKKSLRIEIKANTKSNNLTGSNLTVGWRNRNTFRAGEIFSVNANGGFEIQYSGQLKGYNTYRAGLETSLSFPRFLIPFFNINTKGGFLPRTTLLLGYDILNKQKLYTMNSFRANFGYNWKESIKKEHELNPISITYVNPLLITDMYRDSTKRNPNLLKATERQFILGSNYNYTYNDLLDEQPASGIYFSGGLDLSGNIAGLLTGANIKKQDTAMILNAQFSQYLRTDFDFRVYRKVGDRMVWANRFIAGLGFPYGNSRELPFIKQFFSGGNNSIRAFRSRSVGPGSYIDTTNTFLADQSGDIKLELSSELRFPLFSVVHGAIFADAGNIWLYNENENKTGAEFTKDFLKQVAVGTGFGLRFDFNFLVLRLDLAFPLRIPYGEEGNRWIIDKVNFTSSTWRKENLVFNLAIGYPF